MLYFTPHSRAGGLRPIYDLDLYTVNFLIMRMYFYYLDKYCKLETWAIQRLNLYTFISAKFNRHYKYISVCVFISFLRKFESQFNRLLFKEPLAQRTFFAISLFVCTVILALNLLFFFRCLYYLLEHLGISNLNACLKLK